MSEARELVRRVREGAGRMAETVGETASTLCTCRGEAVRGQAPTCRKNGPVAIGVTLDNRSPAVDDGAGTATVRPGQPDTPGWMFDDEFDGGEETCGRVIINLHLYLKDQAPGLRVLVISRDPGAPVELPAWCRMTRNNLTAMQHPYYLITLKPHLQRS